MQELSRLREVLDSAAVAFFLLPLPQCPPAPPQILGADDRRRLEGMTSDAVRHAFLPGRQFLHTVLHSCIPDGFQVEIDERGKPFCRHPAAPHFNLSHGAGYLALALCRETPVGIDVEDRRRTIPVQALARRYFTPREVEQVGREGPDGFFRIWTRKEARVKAEGLGLAHGNIGSFDVDNAPGWNFHDFQRGDSVIGSLAYAGPERPVVNVSC